MTNAWLVQLQEFLAHHYTDYVLDGYTEEEIRVMLAQDARAWVWDHYHEVWKET